jgi:photosystem II stability/assembly factor-like uncharacterized protein
MNFRLRVAHYVLFVIGMLGLSIALPFLSQLKNSDSSLLRVRSSGSAKAGIEAKIAKDDHYFWMLRDPKSNSIPSGIRQGELEHARITAVMKTSADPQIDWQARGPMNIGGRTRALALDMRNSEIVLAGSVSGGLWKSTDGGTTWTLRNRPEQNLSITWLIQDPRPGFQDTWYYAGGEYIGGSARDRGARAFTYGSGIYRSTDNGDTWNAIPSTVIRNPVVFDSPFDYVSKLAISSVTGTIFMASNAIGIYRSTDGGSNFISTSTSLSNDDVVLGNINEHTYNDVIVLPNGTVVASISGDRATDTAPFAGIYKSTRDGQKGSWENISPNGFPSNHHRTVLAYSPSEPNLVYALTHEVLDGSNYRMNLFRFDVESGASENLTSMIPNLGAPAGNFNPQGGYNMVIAVKPDDPNIVILGGTNLYRSLDRFKTYPGSADLNWIGGYNSGNSFARYPNHHPDQHVVFFDPFNPNRMWSGHDGGVSVTEDIRLDKIAWIDKNRGYVTTQFYTVSIADVAGDQRIIGGTQDNGSLYFVGTEDARDVTSGDGSYAFLGENFAYGATQSGNTYRLEYDVDGNIRRNVRISIQPKGTSGHLFIHPFVVDPIDQNVMYYPERNVLWRNTKISTAIGDSRGFDGSSDGWTKIDLGIPTNLTITSLKASQNPEHVLYIGASQRSNSGTALIPQMYRMDNSRSSNTAKLIPLPGSVTAGSYIHDIAVNPGDADEFIVVMSNYNVNRLFHSKDGGQSYQVVDGNLGNVGSIPGPSVRSAQLLPIKDGTFAIVATSTGVYSTDKINGLNTIWAREGLNELGTVVVERVTARLSDGKVAVGTHGRGIFSGILKLPVVQQKIPEIFAVNPNYPNPFNPETIISFDLPKTSIVSLRVYDILGRPIQTLLNDQELRARTHRIRFQGGSLPSGTYLYRLKVRELEGGTENTVTGKMTLLR